MPGYAIDSSQHKNFVYSDEATLDNVVDKSFFGFIFDPETGNLTIKEIDDGDVVYLPEYGKNDSSDYVTWFWTKKNITFDWDTTKPGHLIMEVL